MTDLPGNVGRERIGSPEPIVVGEVNQQTAAVFASELDMANRDLKSLGN